MPAGRYRWRAPVLLSCLFACRAVPAATPLDDDARQAEHAGTMLQYAIPAAALLATWLAEPAAQDPGTTLPVGSHPLLLDGTPRHDLLLAVGRAWATTTSLKQVVDETRPDGGQHSFPSGHSSMAFAGAEFIRKEYGIGWGAPAYLAAGFVAWSRVEARRHYTHDVLAGAAIGILANHDFWRARTRFGNVALAPASLESAGALAPGLRLELLR